MVHDFMISFDGNWCRTDNDSSESDLEVSQNQENLQVLVKEVLDENKELKRRLSQLEDSFDARSTFTRRPGDDIIQHGGDDNSDVSTIRGVNRSNTAWSSTRVF